jgi:hypothetical protein
MWLYQVNSEFWTVEDYRYDSWEGDVNEWMHGTINGETDPQRGDIILVWFDKGTTEDPGLYGWGIVMDMDHLEKSIAFRPVFPSDLIKMKPIFEDEIEEIVDKVKGEFPIGTMWALDKEAEKEVRELIYDWIE